MAIENKTEITSIRFSKKEKAAILRRAMARGLRLPAHVRDLAVTDAMADKTRTKGDRE